MNRTPPPKSVVGAINELISKTTSLELTNGKCSLVENKFSGINPTKGPHSPSWVTTHRENRENRSAETSLTNGSKKSGKNEIGFGLGKWVKSKLKDKDWKPPKKHANHNNTQYDFLNFPWEEILEKAGLKCDKLPKDFETSGPPFKVSLNPATPLSDDIIGVFPDEHDSDFWKFFATLRVNPGSALKPILGKLLQFRESIILGQDYVYHTREEMQFGRKQNIHYFFFSNLNALFLGTYLIGGEGDDLSFPTALSKHCVAFNQMFTYKRGQIDDVLVTIHDLQWYKNLRELAEEMLKDSQELTCGKLRFALAELRHNVKRQAVRSGKVSLEVNQWFIDGYYPNKLNSLHVASKKILPRGVPKKIWDESLKKREVLMTNSLGNIVKYYRKYDVKRADKESDALKEVNKKEKEGLSRTASMIKQTTRMKTSDELRKIALDNNFLKTNPKEFRLHPKFSLMLSDVSSKFGTLNDEKLREWRLELEVAKQPQSILNVKELYSIEEWGLAQQLFIAGTKTNPEVIKMMYTLKRHHDKQYKKNSTNIVRVAQYAVSSRNEFRHQNETFKLELQSLRMSVDLTRKEKGLTSIYSDNNAENVSREGVDKVEGQIEARNQMIADRGGEFPLDHTAKDLLEGKFSTDNIMTNDNFLLTGNSVENEKGKYFNVSESGYTNEELKEMEMDELIKKDEKPNFEYTEQELEKIAEEDPEPKSKIRKERDFELSMNSSVSSGSLSRDNSFNSDNEMKRNISWVSEPSVIEPMSLIEEEAEMSAQVMELKEKKKPSMRRILPRANKVLADFNEKLKTQTGAFKKSMPRINISDSELAQLEFNVKDFEEIAKRPYISASGEVLMSLKHKPWKKRGTKHDAEDQEKMSLKISLSEMQRSWFSLCLLYPTGIRAILKAVKNINERRDSDRIDVGVLLECANLQNELEIFEGALHDANWANHFLNREDMGKGLCPLPSINLYNTVLAYLPMVRNNLNMKKPHLRKSPSDDRLKKQMLSIHEARMEHRPKAIHITDKDNAKRNDRSKTGKENEGHGQEITDISTVEQNRSEYDLFLDGAYDYDRYNEWLEEHLIPLTREFYRENPDWLAKNGFQQMSLNEEKFPSPQKISTPKKKRTPPLVYNPDFIFVPEPEKKKLETVKVSMNEQTIYYQAKEILERPLGIEINKEKLKTSWPIRDEYVPKFTNEKLKIEVGDLVVSNPMIPTNSEIQVQIGDRMIKTNVTDNEKRMKRPKLYNMSLTYVNLNPPIQIKLKNLVDLSNYSRSAFVCVSEVRTKSELIEELIVIPLGYKVFTHKRTNNDICYAFILVKLDLPGEIETVFDEPPFIVIKWKHLGKSLLIGCLYRPHAKSTVYENEFSKDCFALNLEKLQKIIDRPPAVIFGDFNIDFDKVVTTGDQKVKRLIERCFVKCERLETGNTFVRNKNSNGTKIDYCFSKNVKIIESELENGQNLIGNDGHMIFKVSLNISLNGIIGTTIIKSRPKLDPLVVSKLANSFYDGLKVKLDAAEIIVREKYKVEEHERFNNKHLLSHHDNEYCETAFEFFEKFFAILQPETERKVNIYNYHSKNSSEVMNVNALISELSLTRKSENNKGKLEIDEAIKNLKLQREEYMARDKKLNMIGKYNANDDDVFALARALRPKARKVQMTKEIFSADELAEEYNRVYSGITKHISEAEVTLDILQLCPKINEAFKFSFHDYLPTWNRSEIGVKTIQQCFNSLKAKTRGLDSSLYRDGMGMLPLEFIEIIDNMILYWIKAGNYPEKFLRGKIKSILKKGNAQLIKNRRFISVGNFFQQLLGKITACCVLAYCEYMGFLDDDQYGFRPFRSTDLAVAALLYKVASKSDLCTTLLVYIDFSSAFFCVKKDLLMDILSTFINEEAMVFFRNSLKPITGTVISDGIESEEINVPDYGVRQGGGDSPLQFNLCQNWIFKYVSEPMNTRYDTKYLNIQGFADDSILIATDKENKAVKNLMEKGLTKVVTYVTSVGFSINPSKSEVMVVGKEANREAFGYNRKVNGKNKRYLMTSQGEMEMTEEPNTLGLRYDHKLTFLPQYNHLMKRIGHMKYDIIELLKIGTKRQLIKNAFSKSSGVYTYGIGVQRVWRKYQYTKAQKEVNDLIRLVYDIKWQNENSWRQNDMLRLVKWPPIRIQHAKAALIKLNYVARMPSLKFLYDKVDHHLRYPNGQKVLGDFMRIHRFEDDPLEKNNIPMLVLNAEDKKFMSRKIKHMFPLSVNHWFKDLPDFIKILIGTHEFDQAVQAYYNRACWHREEQDCSLCRNNKVIYGDEINSFQKLLEDYVSTEEITMEEFHSTFNAKYFEDYDETCFDEDVLQDFL